METFYFLIWLSIEVVWGNFLKPCSLYTNKFTKNRSLFRLENFFWWSSSLLSENIKKTQKRLQISLFKLLLRHPCEHPPKPTSVSPPRANPIPTHFVPNSVDSSNPRFLHTRLETPYQSHTLLDRTFELGPLLIKLREDTVLSPEVSRCSC